MEKKTALAINHVSKDFKLPHERTNSLKEKVLSFKKTSFDVFHALDDIDFEVKKGEFFGIVGRNGSGKSTLLKIIGGIYQPTKGSVQVNGTLTPFIELGIGFNPELTGRENVYLNGAILGLTRKEVEQKYQEIVDFAELHKFMDQKLKNYSSGMQVRLAFSIAIQAHNDILLIDEVLAVGDERFQNKCLKVFNEIKASDKTVVFVSHDMASVQRFCDRVAVIHDSKVQFVGDPDEGAYRYKVLNFPEQLRTEDEEAKQLANKHRWGTGQVLCTDLKIDADNKDLRFTFEIDVQDKTLLGTKLTIGLAIYNADENELAGPNSLNSEKSIIAKNGKVLLTIKKHPLNSGDYTVTAVVYDENVETNFDHREKAFSFSVAKKTSQHGSILLEAEWDQR